MENHPGLAGTCENESECCYGWLKYMKAVVYMCMHKYYVITRLVGEKLCRVM